MTQPKIPNELLEKYRDVYVQDVPWWEYIEEYTKEDLRQIGFSLEDMRFRGFWCQGDGASFTGRICDWDAFLTAIDPDGKTYQMLRKTEYRDFELYRINSFYCHENTVSARALALNEWDDITDNEVLNAICAACDEKLLEELDQFKNEALEFLRDRMRKLYRDLEEEYEYLTSDEQVAEYILDCCPEEIEEYRRREGELEEAA